MTPRATAALMALCAFFAVNSAGSRAQSPAAATPQAEPAREAATAITGRTLVWSEEFSGPAGPAIQTAPRWTFATGGGGWGNNELECYTTSRRNSATNGQGQLVITALHEPGHVCTDGHHNSWTSARITTQKSFTVTHGRLEMRAKLPAGAGAWPAFWALGANLPTVGWPRCGEIDVMEHSGNRPRITTSAAHLARYDGTHWYTTRVSPESTTLSSRFHVYAVEWTSTSLTYYRDSTKIGRITRTEVVGKGTWPFDKPFYLLLNLAMGGWYGGTVPATLTSPQRYVIDYVRVYR